MPSAPACTSRSHRSCSPDSAHSCATHRQLCLPDWPWWNRHPLEWREAPDEEEDEEELKKEKAEKAAKKEKKKKDKTKKDKDKGE